MQIANLIDPMANLGSQLGNEFGTGLKALAQHKLNDVLSEKRNQRNSALFQQAGYNPQTAAVLGRLYGDNPQGIANILKLLGNGGVNPQEGLVNQQNQQQGQMQQPNQAQQNQGPTFAQMVGNRSAGASSAQKAQPSVPLLKYQDEKRNELKDIDNLMYLYDAFEKEVEKPDISLGFAQGKLGKISPALTRNRTTEEAQKYANQIVEAKIAALKGIKSKYLAEKIESSKPGLEHRKEVNLRLAREAKQVLKKARKDFIKSHPFLEGDQEDHLIQSSISEPVKQQTVAGLAQFGGFPDPSKFKEDQTLTDKKTGKRVIKRNGKWEAYSGK